MQQGDAVSQAMLIDVDAGHGQRFVADVHGIDHHVRVGHGGQHGEAAVAGAQVEHAVGLVAEPGVDAAVGQHFGDEGTGHDHALVHVEGHALQPGLVRQVGCGLAGTDALVDQGQGFVALSIGDGVVGHLVQRIERMAEAPQDQPSSFVKGVGGAVAKSNLGLGQAFSRLFNQFNDGHVRSLSSVCR